MGDRPFHIDLENLTFCASAEKNKRRYSSLERKGKESPLSWICGGGFHRPPVGESLFSTAKA